MKNITRTVVAAMMLSAGISCSGAQDFNTGVSEALSGVNDIKVAAVSTKPVPLNKLDAKMLAEMIGNLKAPTGITLRVLESQGKVRLTLLNREAAAIMMEFSPAELNDDGILAEERMLNSGVSQQTVLALNTDADGRIIGLWAIVEVRNPDIPRMVSAAFKIGDLESRSFNTALANALLRLLDLK